MPALDLAKLPAARTALAEQGELGAALIPLLNVAEHYVAHGLRWGLIEDTAAAIVAATTKET